MSGYVPSGHWTQNRRLQFIEEVQYGVTPASSPAFTSAGEIESISETTEVAMKRYRTVGTEDLYQFLSSGQPYSFEVSYQPISSALIKYGTQAQGGGAGTIAGLEDDTDAAVLAVQTAVAATNADAGANANIKAEMRAVEQAFLKLRDEVRRYPLALQFIRDKQDA